MHWKVFASCAVVTATAALLHTLVSKETDRVTLSVSLCLCIILAMLGLFLLLGDYLEKGYVHKDELKLLYSPEDSDVFYVDKFQDAVKLKSFDTLKAAEKITSAATIVKDASESLDDPKYWTIEFFEIGSGGHTQKSLPSNLQPASAVLSDIIHSCAAGFITTRI